MKGGAKWLVSTRRQKVEGDMAFMTLESGDMVGLRTYYLIHTFHLFQPFQVMLFF